MLFRTYKTLTNLAEPLLKRHINKRLKQGKEDANRLNERFGQPQKARPDGKLIWFHAASVGEAVTLLALIKKISDEHDSINLMLTTGTVTSANMIAKKLPKNAFHQYIPVDVSKWTESFLNYWKPDLVIWSESDFWPNILDGVNKRNIPTVLVNAIVSEEAFKTWNIFAKGFAKKMLSVFDLCLAQDDAETERLIKLGAKNTKTFTNLKYAADILPYDEKTLEDLKTSIGDRPYILWASTHKGEEEIACEVHVNLAKEIPNLLTIILPRHPARKDEIVEILNKSGLAFNCRSDDAMPQKENDIYLADTLGETGLFYGLKPIFINGGTFVPIGGHNIIEPAMFSCPIFYGPYMSTCITIHNDFAAQNASTQVSNQTELQDELLNALKNPKEAIAMGEKAKTLTQEKSHVIDEVMNEINPFINKVLKNA